MKKIEVILNNEAGLHARPASLLISESSKFESNIIVEKNNKQYNAKSILSILSMAAGKGDKLSITAEGEDEAEAIESLKILADNNFGE